MTDNRECV